MTTPDPSPIEQTQATYTAVAPAYFAQNQDRASLERLLRRLVKFAPDGPILDAGCGPGFDADTLQGWGHSVAALDMSMAMMQTGRPYFPTVRFTQGDLCHLPFAAGTFAGVWMMASLLHLPRPDAAAALLEARRVLCPDGIGFISVKEGTGEGWAGAPGSSTQRRYFIYWQPDQLDAALTAAGFTILNGWTTGIWLSRFVQRR